MSDTIHPCKSHVEVFNQLEGFGARVPIAFKLLLDHGKIMVPKRFDRIHGQRGLCYQNAFSNMDLDHCYVEGYAMKQGLIPLAHAWLMDEDGYAIDPTWADGHYYYGVPFDNDFIMEHADRTGYYGVFEGLYLLKMEPDAVYNYLLQGIKRD